MRGIVSTRRWVSPAIIALALTGGVSLQADVLTGNSYGYGLQLDTTAGTGATLDLLGLGVNTSGTLTVDTSRLPSTATGSAPGIYDTGVVSTIKVFAAGNMASVVGLSLGPVLGTEASATAALAGTSGTFNGRANSNVDGLPGSRTAHGFGSVEGLRLDLSDLSLTADTLLISPLSVNPPPLVSFTQAENTTLSSDSTVTGDANAFNRTGTSVIADLSLSVNGGAGISLSSLLTDAAIAFNTDAFGNISVAPNTTLSLGATASGAVWPGLASGLIPGVTVGAGTLLQLTLNKQEPSGDLSTSAGITTTALEIKLSGLNMGVTAGSVATLGVTGGLDIYLGQSQAQLTAIPEPSTWAAGIACVTVGIVGWRRNRRSARQANA